jgi:type I restriction enzyme, S subunit
MSGALPSFPAKWQVAKIRRKLRALDGIRIGPFGSALTLDQMVESGFKVYGQENVIAEDFAAGTRYISPAKYQELRNCAVSPGDLLVTMMGTTGRCAVVPEGIVDGIMDSHLIRLRFCDCDVDPVFMGWLIDKGYYIREQLKAGGKGTIMSGLNSSIIKDVWIGLPRKKTQTEIVHRATEVTGKVDRLVALRRRQMELLRQQRTALIQQAVTRGLNPRAPLKDSGLPWLGQIPKHWEMKEIRHLVPRDRQVMYGIVLPGPNVDEGVPIVKAGNCEPGRLSIESMHRTTVEIEAGHVRSRLQAGDIVFAIRGSFGQAEIVPPELEGANLTQDAARIATKAGIHNRWLWYSVRSQVFFAQMDSVAVGATIRGVNIRDLKRAKLVVPPLSEQKTIAAFLDEEGDKTDRLLAAYTRQLELLTEYRAALIHECVTGQRAVPHEIQTETPQRHANVHFQRSVLAAEIIHRLHNEATFGRVKLEKIIYLSEAFAGIDLEGHYQRAAAGPFDNRALRSIESQIQKHKWYQPVKRDKGTRYIAMEKAGTHHSYFEKYWPEQRVKFERLIELLRPLKTENCEMIATVYAVHKDRLAAKLPVSDDLVVDEVLNNWHPNKQKIPRERWLKALAWMREKQLLPGGNL